MTAIKSPHRTLQRRPATVAAADTAVALQALRPQRDGERMEGDVISRYFDSTIGGITTLRYLPRGQSVTLHYTHST